MGPPNRVGVGDDVVNEVVEETSGTVGDGSGYPNGRGTTSGA